MNWLHADSKTLKRLAKTKVAKPDLISIGLSIAHIANDSYGAYKASNITQEHTTRLIARQWLQTWFRSGFNLEYMNKLINNNDTQLAGRGAQIEALADKYASTDALCDAWQFFNKFADCSVIGDKKLRPR